MELGHQKRAPQGPRANQQKEERGRGRQGQVLQPRSAPPGRLLRWPQDRERVICCFLPKIIQ